MMIMHKWVNRIWAALQRFPLPALCSLLYFVFSINMFSVVALAVLFCGYFWFIALKLFTESKKWHWYVYYLIGLPVFLAIFRHFHTSLSVFFSAVFLSSGLFFLVMTASSLPVWFFNYRFITHIFLAMFAGGLLYLGITAIFMSVDYLFGIKIPIEMHEKIFLAVFTFFVPIFILFGIPHYSDKEEKVTLSAVIRIVIPYIVIPLLLIYAVILYGYIFKIMAAGTLPKGGVVYLVSAFGVSGVMTYLISYPLHAMPGIGALFTRYFFPLFVLPLGLLAVGIGVRIHEYGITESRYAVLLCLLWFILCTFFVFIKKQQPLKHIIFSPALLLVLASFGPLSAYNVSGWSQYGRLKTLIHKKSLSRTEQITMSEIVDYLVGNNKENLISPRYSKLLKTQPNKAKFIVQDLGFPYLESSERSLTSIEQVNFSNRNSVIVTTGYDYIVDVDLNSYLSSSHATGLTAERSLDSNDKLIINVDPNLNAFIVIEVTQEAQRV